MLNPQYFSFQQQWWASVRSNQALDRGWGQATCWLKDASWWAEVFLSPYPNASYLFWCENHEWLFPLKSLHEKHRDNDTFLSVLLRGPNKEHKLLAWHVASTWWGNRRHAKGKAQAKTPQLLPLSQVETFLGTPGCRRRTGKGKTND